MGIKTYEIWLRDGGDMYLRGIFTGTIRGIFSTKIMAEKHIINPTEHYICETARKYIIKTNARTYRKIKKFFMDNYPNLCVFE